MTEGEPDLMEAVWFVGFHCADPGYGYVAEDRVTFTVLPNFDAYAGRRLYELAIGADSVTPVPPPGPVYCIVTAADHRPGDPPLGQAMRQFLPTDPVYSLRGRVRRVGKDELEG